MMYQIRLQFSRTWQMTTWQRGGGPQLTNHPVKTLMVIYIVICQRSGVSNEPPEHGQPGALEYMNLGNL